MLLKDESRNILALILKGTIETCGSCFTFMCLIASLVVHLRGWIAKLGIYLATCCWMVTASLVCLKYRIFGHWTRWYQVGLIYSHLHLLTQLLSARRIWLIFNGSMWNCFDRVQSLLRRFKSVDVSVSFRVEMSNDVNSSWNPVSICQLLYFCHVLP